MRRLKLEPDNLSIVELRASAKQELAITLVPFKIMISLFSAMRSVSSSIFNGVPVANKPLKI